MNWLEIMGWANDMEVLVSALRRAVSNENAKVFLHGLEQDEMIQLCDECLEKYPEVIKTIQKECSL